MRVYGAVIAVTLRRSLSMNDVNRQNLCVDSQKALKNTMATDFKLSRSEFVVHFFLSVILE